MSNRTLRHNLDAEASILGGILLRNESLSQLERLEVEDFYHFPHRVVFEAIRNLEAGAKPIDVVTLENEVEKMGKLDAIGGVAFLGELAARVPTVDNVLAYAEIVQGLSLLRRLTLFAAELAERSCDDEAEPEVLLGEAMAGLAKLDRAKPDTAVTIGELVKRRLLEIDAISEARQNGNTSLTGVPTGIAGLDKRLSGYQFGIVNLLAARPAMGKTAMAMACVDAATAAGFAAHVFSQEDGWRAYADRALARMSGISAEKLRQAEFDRTSFLNLTAAVARLRDRKTWHVDDRAGLTAAEIVRSVRRHRKQWGTRLVVVDYVQLVQRSRALRHDENAALDEIMTTFAQAAKADDIAYLVLSQLNRETEKRNDRRPQLSDLRGSGSLEERSKIVVSPFRSAYYSDKPRRHIDWECDCPERLETCSHAPSQEAFERTVQVLVLKNNNGQTGRVFATWRGETTEMS